MISRAKVMWGAAVMGVLALLASALVLLRNTVHAEMLRADPDRILADAALRPRALHDGRAVYVKNCAVCHGDAGKGDAKTGVPDLTDDNFLYGSGQTSEIEQIVLHGIRAGDSKGWDLAWMPAYAHATPYARDKIPPLSPEDIRNVVAFLRAANGNAEDPARIEAGWTIFETRGGCWDCHGHDAAGDPAIGAPNLVNNNWLQGNGSEADLTQIISEGMHNVSPAFRGRLTPYAARVVSAYVAALHPQKGPARP